MFWWLCFRSVYDNTLICIFKTNNPQTVLGTHTALEGRLLFHCRLGKGDSTPSPAGCHAGVGAKQPRCRILSHSALCSSLSFCRTELIEYKRAWVLESKIPVVCLWADSRNSAGLIAVLWELWTMLGFPCLPLEDLPLYLLFPQGIYILNIVFHQIHWVCLLFISLYVFY